MGGSITSINNSVHQKVQTLLPWFAVETLAGDEWDMVNQHLRICAECQAELTWHRKLQAMAPSDNANHDVDRAFAKLLPRLAAAQRVARRRSFAEFLHSLRYGNTAWMRWAMAAQFSVIVVLVLALVTPFGNVAAYRALGGAKNSGGNMVVVFKPETSEQDLRRILRDAGARIVDGPTVTDGYLLNVPNENLTKALHDLRSDRAVILAESLDSGVKR